MTCDTCWVSSDIFECLGSSARKNTYANFLGTEHSLSRTKIQIISLRKVTYFTNQKLVILFIIKISYFVKKQSNKILLAQNKINTIILICMNKNFN